MGIKLLLLSAVVYCISCNRIGYVPDDSDGFSDGEKWIDDEGFVGSGQFSQDDVGVKVSDDGGMIAGFEDEGLGAGGENPTTTKNGVNETSEEIKRTMRDEDDVNEQIIEKEDVGKDDENDGDMETTIRSAPSRKTGTSGPGKTRWILLSIPLEAWLILGSYLLLVILVSIIMCCLVCVRWKMKSLSKTVKTDKEMKLVKDRLTAIEDSKDDTNSFRRSARFPVTDNVKKMTDQSIGDGFVGVRDTSFAARGKKTKDVSTMTASDDQVDAAGTGMEVVVNVVASANDHDNTIDSEKMKPPPGPIFGGSEDEDVFHDTD